MVHGSSSGSKKKTKKAAKRKPVNLQPQYLKYAQGDFHMHSTCSDGKFRPAEVVAKAAANGVMFLSLTDHDTMAGVTEAMEAGRSLGVFVLPGVEISAEEKGAENLHILGYFCPGTDSVEIEAKLLAIRQARHKRGKEMLRKLADMGIQLNWERVLQIAGEAAPGRPHVAEALVEGGHVSTFREAFSRYLSNDGPAYAEGEHFPPQDAIRMIENAGGVSVLAHPWCCKDPLTLVPTLAAAGIHGVEVYHDSGKIDLYGSLATESNLLKLGGSDFHGIDSMTEHAPGDIPLPRKHIDLFLDMCKVKWTVPLLAKVNQMCSSANDVERTTIWTAMLGIVQDTVAAAYSNAVTLTHVVDGHYTDIEIVKVAAPAAVDSLG
ncbi:hypothetical protein, variant [Aphanomyces invadans]|uniref:Polymerase/histidinol phosphatase N-terminal domain-containing protein n=1 Tax=Aphanomyces invadans TaxID=157072 RepID=A0A024U264_9STRA|nr:hypothetical protein, variant [Aphanomyces invadans]ETV99712.1 hypothetical protein, variant [Aphanomyces invadans]|eukprot:XP_008871488.1 hypothetical protein, variant [Aphanomyces invadans]